MPSNNSMGSVNENADGSGTVEKTGVIVGAETSIDGPPACGVRRVSVPKVEMVNVGELMSMMRSAFAGPSVGISNPELSRRASENSSGMPPLSRFVVSANWKLSAAPGLKFWINWLKKELSVIARDELRFPVTPRNSRDKEWTD